MENKPKILLVDDAPSNLLLLSKLLTKVDAETVAVECGEDALRALEEQEFALVLLDIHMPDIDGFEVLQQLRKAENNKSVPVILVSAIYREQTHQIRGHDSGAVDFIPKPIIPAILLGKVRVFIELYNKRKELEEKNRMLEDALDRIKTLEGIIPICTICKNIRNEEGFWNAVEDYMSRHSKAAFSHSVCPECLKKYYPDTYKELYPDGNDAPDLSAQE